MNHNTKIQALADLAVKRGDYRAGSKNYEAYIKSLLELSVDEIDRRYEEETRQAAAVEKTAAKVKKSDVFHEYDSQAKWRNNNSRQINIRFMTKGDADILAALEGKQASQEIRRLIRLGIEADRKQKEEEGQR